MLVAVSQLLSWGSTKWKPFPSFKVMPLWRLLFMEHLYNAPMSRSHALMNKFLQYLKEVEVFVNTKCHSGQHILKTAN